MLDTPPSGSTLWRVLWARTSSRSVENMRIMRPIDCEKLLIELWTSLGEKGSPRSPQGYSTGRSLIPQGHEHVLHKRQPTGAGAFARLSTARTRDYCYCLFCI